MIVLIVALFISMALLGLAAAKFIVTRSSGSDESRVSSQASHSKLTELENEDANKAKIYAAEEILDNPPIPERKESESEIDTRSSRGILYPQYRFIMASEESGSFVYLSNPIENEGICDFIYIIKQNGTEIATSAKISPGKRIPWDVVEMLEYENQNAKYDLSIEIIAYEIESDIEIERTEIKSTLYIN